MININREKQYMALAPLSSLAGIFINPLASTLAPLVLYFIFRNKRFEVSKAALQTADLAFSIQLWIVLISLALMMGISLDQVSNIEARQMMDMSTSIILLLFIASLFYAIYCYLTGKPCSHILSFKIAERVLKLTDKSRK